MKCEIENENLKIIANTHGGNVKAIIGKKNNVNYIWNGRPFAWQLNTDVLFPVIGRVKDWTYKYNDKVYFMPTHGFASSAKYKLIENKDDKLSFELKSYDETEEIYPFKFILTNEYKLVKNKLITTYTIKNIDEKDIYFSIGVHPSFACPMYGANDKLEDYYLKFDQKEEKTTILEIDEHDYLTGNKKVFKENYDEIPINAELFQDGTKIFDNLKSNKVSLMSRKHDRSITVDFTDFPILSLWAPDRMTDFVCIEPWNGHADMQDFKGDISEKEGIIKLESNKQYVCSYSITINE